MNRVNIDIITLKYRIINCNKVFENTRKIYIEVLSFIINIVNIEWDNIKELNINSQVKVVENLIHYTNKNPHPKYNNFDKLYYKFPSYFRRSAISKAIGIVSSYKSNYMNWEIKRQESITQGKIFKEKSPHLNLKHYVHPVFYKDNMFKDNKLNDKLGFCKIKIYQNNDWVWLDVIYKNNNIDLTTQGYTMNCPSLVKKGNKYYLHISYEKEKDKLNNVPINEQIAIGVDLGITNSAVCCSMKSDGTVLGRIFINQPKEKDRMIKKLGIIAKAQRASGDTRKPNLWRIVNNYQEHIVKDTASRIVKFAIKYNASVIVMEYLDVFKPMGSYFNRRRQKLHHWCKLRVQQRVEEMAHRVGIRIRRINARNTSLLAFDGSGEVIRNYKKDICVFSTGKEYHSDLNASYNIVSRYFIRELLKPLSEMTRLSLEAKVPLLAKRTSFVLSTLISLNKVLTTC